MMLGTRMRRCVVAGVVAALATGAVGARAMQFKVVSIDDRGTAARWEEVVACGVPDGPYRCPREGVCAVRGPSTVAAHHAGLPRGEHGHPWHCL